MNTQENTQKPILSIATQSLSTLSKTELRKPNGLDPSASSQSGSWKREVCLVTIPVFQGYKDGCSWGLGKNERAIGDLHEEHEMMFVRDLM